MDSEIIFSKTASGEEAMHQRTRVMQRNVRMVLILVDGQSTIADLSLKTGNTQLTENALRELEKGGFVERRVEQDSLWAESKRVAQEIRAAAIDKALQFSSPRTKKNSNMPEPSIPETPISIHSAFQVQTPRDSSTSPFSLAPIQTERSQADLPLAILDQEEKKSKPPRKQERNTAEPRLSLVERVRRFFPNTNRKSVTTGSIKPIRRGPRNSTGWPATVVLSILGVLAIAYLTISFFPYDIYLPEVQGVFAQAIGRPVRVGGMRIDIYPRPGLFLDNVRIGADKDELRIAEMRLQPAIGTLTSPKISFREVMLSGVTLPAELIPGLQSVFVAMSKSTARVGIEHLGFEKTDISYGGLVLSSMTGEARLNAQGLFQSLLLQSTERNLSLELVPRREGLDVTLEGFGWRPSQGSRFLFDTASMKGNLENGTFTISNFEFHIFDGVIQGTASLPAEAKPTIAGKLVFDRINSTRLGDAFGIGQQFSGEAAGKVDFSTTADSWATIDSAIYAGGEFTMRRGSIRGIDLTEAVRRVAATPIQGGATQFEQLSGKIKLTPSSYRFSELILNSGLMQSTGNFEVSRDLTVNGKMELQMRGTVNQTRVPVSITGPLKTPVVQIGKR